ncbi:MAG: HU family DNA-binding protein [Firmicutes bacterium]|nr:HU family DNA-binding protein [Bacillota bacterium]
MNKSDLIVTVSEKTEMAKKDVEKIVNAVIESIIDTVKSDEKVQLVGFGTFERRYRAERQGRNPATNEEITIPALYVPVFKAGKAFRDKVK